MKWITIRGGKPAPFAYPAGMQETWRWTNQEKHTKAQITRPWYFSRKTEITKQSQLNRLCSGRTITIRHHSTTYAVGGLNYSLIENRQQANLFHVFSRVRVTSQNWLVVLLLNLTIIKIMREESNFEHPNKKHEISTNIKIYRLELQNQQPMDSLKCS